MRNGYFISNEIVVIYETFLNTKYYFHCLPSKMQFTQKFDDISIPITDKQFIQKWFLKNKLNNQYYQLDEDIIDYIEDKYKEDDVKFIDMEGK